MIEELGSCDPIVVVAFVLVRYELDWMFVSDVKCHPPLSFDPPFWMVHQVADVVALVATCNNWVVTLDADNEPKNDWWIEALEPTAE
jgi:hypothetical protein